MPGISTEEREARRSPDTYRNAATAGWTDERCARLAQLWAEGWSGSEIASELGNVSRNGVIGKIHRLGLADRTVAPLKTNIRYEATPRPPKPKRAPAKPKARAPYIPAPWLPLQLLPEAKPGDQERLKGSAWAALPDSTPMPLLAVAEAGGCRWPIGEERPYLFCGEAIHARHFCAAHYALAYTSTGKVNLTKPTGKFTDSRILDEEAA